MININDKILPHLNEAECWLLLHIAKRLAADMTCFPSNKTMLEDTGWALSKLKRTKRSLSIKNILKSKSRFNKGAQTSNFYKINTPHIGIYIPLNNTEFEQENDLTPRVQNEPPPRVQNEPPPRVQNEPPILSINQGSINQGSITLSKAEQNFEIFSLEKSCELALQWCQRNSATIENYCSIYKIKNFDEKMQGEILKFFSHYRTATSDEHFVKKNPVDFFREKFPGWMARIENYSKPHQAAKKSKTGPTEIKPFDPNEKQPF